MTTRVALPRSRRSEVDWVEILTLLDLLMARRDTVPRVAVTGTPSAAGATVRLVTRLADRRIRAGDRSRLCSVAKPMRVIVYEG